MLTTMANSMGIAGGILTTIANAMGDDRAVAMAMGILTTVAKPMGIATGHVDNRGHSQGGSRRHLGHHGQTHGDS